MTENAETKTPVHPDCYAELVAAAEIALEHVKELREAWRTGAIRECDGNGGTRSNRNVDVEVRLRRVLETTHV